MDRAEIFGSPARTRTADPMVNSHLLCQLSYWGVGLWRLKKHRPVAYFGETELLGTKNVSILIIFNTKSRAKLIWQSAQNQEYLN